MSRLLVLLYGLLSYGLFLAVFLYLVAFNADLGGVAKTVSSGTPGPLATALAVNIFLLALFGIQHTIMARTGFKRALTRIIPVAAERSTYVMATNVVLILLMLYWQPLSGTAWQIENTQIAMGMHAISGLGWLLVLISTFLTNHFDLFGLRQIYLNAVGKTYSTVGFKEILFYRWIRHPMMLGLLIAFWSIPVMSMSHLLFTTGMSLYILIGIHFEERGLRAELGESYINYQRRTRRVLPFVY